MMILEVNGVAMQIKLEQNSSADAMKELISQGSITIPMKDYAHMEKFGNFGTRLPRNDKQITTKAGDVILSEGNFLVIYYAPNTWFLFYWQLYLWRVKMRRTYRPVRRLTRR